MLDILIIEDEPVNQEFLKLALKAHGRCLAVPTGEAGLLAHRRALDEGRPFRLVFLDLMLPGMGGLAALERLRAAEEESGLPESARAQVIVTTVLDDDAAAQRAFVHGRAASYLVKPFRAAQVLEELRSLGLLEG